MSSSEDAADAGVLGRHRGVAKNNAKTTTAQTSQSKHPVIPTLNMMKKSKIPGGGQIVEIDMMQYCNAEMELPLEKHFDIMGQIDDEDSEEAMELVDLNLLESEGDSNSTSNKSSSKENESSNNSNSTSVTSSDSDKKKYRPLPKRKPNREASIFESESTKEHTTKEEKSDNPTYHPALRAAIFTEGQEVMWHEDEYSTVSSVMVKPKPEALGKIDDKIASHKPPSRPLLPFFHRQKNQEEKAVADVDPIKIYVKRKKVKKSVVLLPQQDDANQNKLLELDAAASAEQEAVTNMIKARELLKAALVLGETPRLEESEEMARFAFQHAQLARRMAESHAKNIKGENTQRDEGSNENQKELEHVLSYLAEQGQEAVYQHQKAVFSESYEDDEDEEEEGDDGENQEENRTKTKQKMSKRSGFSEYALRAVHYLESILPKNVGDQSKESIAKLNKALSAEDYWSDAGISTLGMKNDTFEYGFSCGAPSIPPVVQSATSRFNMDLMSLSSLNEILDGPLDDENQTNAEDPKGKISPREVVPVIDVPQRTPSKKNRIPPTRKSILGLVTPSAKRHGLKSLLTPRKNLSMDGSSSQATKQVKNHNMWIMFPAKKPEEAVEFLPIVEENEVSDRREEQNLDLQSDAALGGIDLEDNQDNLDDVENPLLEGEPKVVSLREIKSDSTDSHGFGGEERYNPPSSTNGMNLSTSATFKGPTLSMSTSKSMKDQAAEEWDNDVYQRNINELRSTSIAESEGSSPNGISGSKSKCSVSGQSDWDESFHLIPPARSKGCEEPVGKTPRRGRQDIEPSLSRSSGDGVNIPVAPSRNVLAIADFDMGDKKNSREEKSKPRSKGHNVKTKTSDEERKATVTVEKKNAEPNSDSKFADISVSGKSNGAHSEGSKTKIFGRIVDRISNKKNPLIPNAVVEETYVVTASLKKSMSKGVPHRSKEQANAAQTIAHPEKKSKKAAAHLQKQKEEKNVEESQKISEKAAKKRAHHHNHNPKEEKKIEEIKKSSEKAGEDCRRSKNHKPLLSKENAFSDSTVVIEQAVSNGNLKALQSNEEEDEAPENYLALMLRKKAKEQRERTQDEGSVNTERTPIDADSFVAAIRGPRHQECPGVALEGIATRNPNRDPTTSDGNDQFEIRNLAPTPRRPERMKVLNGNDPANDHDPPLDDTRERQRMITERLYAAGSSSFDENNTSTKLSESTPNNNNKDCNVDHDLLRMAPTVDSAASYDDEAETGVEVSHINDKQTTDTIFVEEASKSDRKSARRKRMSFFPSILKHKIQD
ncbi:hypothetical protein IV203_018806 [Nitzschia inconspicua]|uniref:Uncharacterized protein n=1 Tax=Nitzschia inconspicua TaxID=303405 RepID=A0A9K3M2P7_9STRA|nr:hypothetical protein IV203_018806 [Nitzschia inconspicua]